MQPSTIFIPLFFVLLPLITMASNTDEKIHNVCESDEFKEFPTEKLGDCFDYGKEVYEKINTILLVIMSLGIVVTVLLELKGRWEIDPEKVATTSKNPLSSFGEGKQV